MLCFGFVNNQIHDVAYNDTERKSIIPKKSFLCRGFSVPGNVCRVRCDAIEAFSHDHPMSANTEDAEEAIAHAGVQVGRYSRILYPLQSVEYLDDWCLTRISLAKHVTFQVLLVSPALLQWARLSRGRLSLNFLLSSERLVAFLIGVKKSEIHNDHEVNFLTASELSEDTPPLKQVLFQVKRFLSALDRCGMIFEASESNDEQFALAAFNGIKSTLKEQQSR